MEDRGATLTGARRLSAGSDCACGETAICTLSHLLCSDSLRHERYHQGVERNALRLRAGDQPRVERTRHPLHEAPADRGKRPGNAIAKLLRNGQPRLQRVTAVLDCILRCGSIGPATRKIGEARVKGVGSLNCS